MQGLKVFKTLVMVLLLTLLTQVGGIIYLVYLLSYRWINRLGHTRKWNWVLKPVLFAGIYVLLTLTVIPWTAQYFGRVPLPVAADPHLQPLNPVTWLLNRHYVSPVLKDVTTKAASKLSKHYPATVLYYLDANFPFVDGFPLLPHLSHNDGKKLDLAFYYLNAHDRSRASKTPSFIGYGVFVDPVKGEIDQPSRCEELGHWQYTFMQRLVPQGNKADYVLDQDRTKAMINFFTLDERIKKIFLEPHLKTRMGLASPKIRYHGCHSVRHDDHIHIQI